MGSGVGVFTDEEVKHLKEKDKEELKNRALQELQASKEINEIIGKNQVLLTNNTTISEILREIAKIREILREKLRPLKDQLENK